MKFKSWQRRFVQIMKIRFPLNGKIRNNISFSIKAQEFLALEIFFCVMIPATYQMNSLWFVFCMENISYRALYARIYSQRRYLRASKRKNIRPYAAFN